MHLFHCFYFSQLDPSQLRLRRPYQVLYAIGGWDGQSVVPSVEWYDPDSSTQWKSGPALGQPRKRLAVASLDGRVYAVGGSDGKNALSSVEVFDQHTRQWTPLSPMHHARMFAACVTLDGKLYAIGGQRKMCVPLESVEVFDPRLDTWRCIASMPCKQGSPTAVTHKGLIYVLGKASGDIQNLQVYSPSSDTWKQVATTLPYRRYSTAVYCAGALYVLGGTGSRRGSRVGENSDVFRYDPETGEWSVVCQMASPRAGFAVAVVNGAVVVVGGHVDREKLYSADLYDPESRKWRSLPDMAGRRCVLGAVAVTKLV